jgi:hypothetical protein
MLYVPSVYGLRAFFTPGAHQLPVLVAEATGSIVRAQETEDAKKDVILYSCWNLENFLFFYKV